MIPSPGTGRGPGFPREALEGSIISRFDAIVPRFLERIAVRTGSTTLSYRELDSRAKRVAAGILMRRGPAPEPIGLLLRQGAELCTAILGVLKAGKFYVPLDPLHPAVRIDRIRRSAGIRFIITEGGEPGEAGVPLSTLITEESRLPSAGTTSDSFAYVFYTSGSTGEPKGVVDTHRNVLHNVLRYTNSLGIVPEDRLSLIQGPAFSGTVSSLFGALLNGATVCPYDMTRSGAGRALAEWVREHEITIYHSVPAIFRSMVAEGGTFPSVRIIRLEGDAATRRDVELFRAHFGPQCRLVHGLGATETGLSRQFVVRRETPVQEGFLPLGFATEDMEALVVSEDGAPCPAGTIGEIVIRSRYLAPGYWNRPDLTQAAFGSATETDGRRSYRTGDLGRLGSDGCLEYLGRRNAGFKIRGNRIEPAEVEGALLGIEGVREAAVTGQPGADGERELVAYLVTTERAPLSPATLRESLRRVLPDALVPSRFVFLAALPTDDNGKVDRRALPWPPPDGDQPRAGYLAPRDSLEQRLVELWEQALGTAPIGVQDDFFDLGGDSLRAAGLVAALDEIAGRELSPGTILAAPTIERLAQIIRDGRPTIDSVLVEINPGATGRPLFCIPEHTGRLGGGLASLGRHLGASQALFFLQGVGAPDGEPPLTSIRAMASRYREAMRSIQPRGPYALAGRCFGAVVALEIGHQLLAAGETVDLLFFIDVTPEDFPGLVPEPLRRRFRLHRWSERIRQEIPEVRRRKAWKRLPYLAREIARAILVRIRARRIRARLARGGSLPPAWDLGTVNREAFAIHRSRPWPGAVSLMLREGDRDRYGPRPADAWAGLARDVGDIHYLAGSPLQFREPSQVRAVAEVLRARLSPSHG